MVAAENRWKFWKSGCMFETGKIVG